ncbi:fasciclin-like arabinogalactan protein 21 [Rhododendron vialii]|uniref:fasciclin-like arabinogalactan protein 21 n=1 Tax=Rhododendron vialii TaxID=182163 RepID=UPI00265DABD6|nr:fasciclin-like arabinogalactan protein 21 [Rhododendron vialii]
MANRDSLHLLLVALTISTLLRPISTSHSSPHSSSPPTTATTGTTYSTIRPPKPSSPPPPPSLPPQEQLLENIVSALLTAGDFRHWANLLSATDPSTLTTPLSTATLFVPSDQALSHFPTPTASPLISFDPFLIPYHIIPQRLPFSDLQLFKPLTRLPTLLPSNSILITVNSHSNFSVDGSPITHPDLYVNSAVAVHGVNNVLDYSVYGGGDRRSPSSPVITKGPETETVAPPYVPCCGTKSGAAGLGSDEFTLVLVVVGAAFAFKI